MPDLIVRGGMVVTPAGFTACDIAVEGGLISAIGPALPGASSEIDATGLTVLPGMIDVHVHFNEPGRGEWEGAETGSHALAAGGGTTFFDMPLNSSPCTVRGCDFDDKRAALEAASIADFGLWGGLIPGNRESMGELAERGVIGFKAFLSDSGLPEFPRADDLTLFEGMREAARFGLPVGVHAESEEITKGLMQRLRGAGREDVRAYLESRPVIAEVEAIRRAGVLAREARCKLHIVHISSGSGVAAALQARAEGTDITLETCPHYLFFTDADMERIGAAAKCAPPLREKSEHDALWAALLRDEIDIVGSDHSPCLPEMKERDSFFEIWGGIAGVQFTLPVLIGQGLKAGRIAALTAANGSRRFGILNKGAIAVGYEADLALIDWNAALEITEKTMRHKHRVSPYAGYSLKGAVRKTIRRGEVIFSDGEVVAPATGKLVSPKRN